MTDDLVKLVAAEGEKAGADWLFTLPSKRMGSQVEAIARAIIPLVQAAEQERCARVADRYMGGDVIAAAIRAGGQP